MLKADKRGRRPAVSPHKPGRRPIDPDDKAYEQLYIPTVGNSSTDRVCYLPVQGLAVCQG